MQGVVTWCGKFICICLVRPPHESMLCKVVVNMVCCKRVPLIKGFVSHTCYVLLVPCPLLLMVSHEALNTPLRPSC